MEQSAGGAVASFDLQKPSPSSAASNNDSSGSRGRGRGRGGGRHHHHSHTRGGGGRAAAKGGGRGSSSINSNDNRNNNDNTNANSNNNAEPNSNNSTKEETTRGGGRGGRGGRGRGRHGRGGRGRGQRGNSSRSRSPNRDNKNTSINNNEEATTGNNKEAPETKEPHDHAANTRDGETKAKGGRGAGRSGRGRGRSARGGRGGGRGGRGRGRSNATPTNTTKENSGHEEQVHTDTIAEKIATDTVTHGDAVDQNNASSNPTPPQALQQHMAASNNGILNPQDDSALATSTNAATTNTNGDHENRQQQQQVLSLPTPPTGLMKKGGPVILLRHNHPPTPLKDGENPPQQQTQEKKEKKKKPKKKKKEKTPKKKAKPTNGNNGDDDEDEGYDEEDDEEEVGGEPDPDVSAMQALAAMPAQEVSITSNTIIQIKRNDNSSASLKGMTDKEATSNTKDHKKSSKSSKKKGKGGTKNGVKEGGISAKAARKFNNDVRACVERSDPDAMREILRNKKNHHFALDKTVLETVMKAYVMAAMFDDALYCLRNCTLPGTLSTLHTERILTCLPQNLRNSSAYTAADMINALCIATEFDNPTSRTYFLRIVRGISLEFLEEATSARDRICSAPCERLVRSGLCVVDARFKRGKKATELVVVPGEQLGVFVPDTMENRGIQAGDAVSILPYAGPYPMSAESLDRNMIEATVINTNPTVIRLQDKTNANLHAMLTENIDGNVYRIDKLANRMGFNRQLSAAVAVASPLEDIKTRDTRRPCPELIRAITAMDENIDRAMKMAGGFARGLLTSTAALCSQAIPWSYQDEDQEADPDVIRQSSHLALEKYKALEGLNASQSLAVEGAVTNRLTLVQGPPGTGKTAVAIRILQHWARLAQSSAASGENPSPILATSDSNIAVDNLVEGCASVGLSVVRLGRPEAIRPELLRFCIDRPPSSYGSSNNNASNGYSGGGGGNSSVMNFKERMKALKNAQVICCTCIGSGGDILDAMTFDRVLVDEATQATEPAVIVPLMRGCRQLVLVGDHCQLPPTVLSTRAEEEGHGVPLFSRMVACGVPPFMLDTQYRMHPCIAMFPSDLFYGGKLRNGVSAPERRPLAGFPWPREEFPVAFYPVKGVEMDDGVSKYNEAEAEVACRAVQALLAGGQCTASDIAVVTPYAAQARLIRRLTRRLLDTAGPPYIEVASVDGFQGREKEAVVFSAVRSNDYGAIGFTSDWRRVNVSFTRARRALVVIGNDATLRRGDPDTWSPWLAWADAHGLNMDKPGIPRGRYDPEQLRRVRGGTTAAEMLKDVLARQQAQLKNAEKQLQKAEKSTGGNITGGVYDDDGTDDKNSDGAGKGLSLEEDLARLENTDGHWDDTDDEDEHGVSQVSSGGGLTSNDVSRVGSEEDDSDSPQDAWDL